MYGLTNDDKLLAFRVTIFQFLLSPMVVTTNVTGAKLWRHHASSAASIREISVLELYQHLLTPFPCQHLTGRLQIDISNFDIQVFSAFHENTSFPVQNLAGTDGKRGAFGVYSVRTRLRTWHFWAYFVTSTQLMAPHKWPLWFMACQLILPQNEDCIVVTEISQFIRTREYAGLVTSKRWNLTVSKTCSQCTIYAVDRFKSMDIRLTTILKKGLWFKRYPQLEIMLFSTVYYFAFMCHVMWNPDEPKYRILQPLIDRYNKLTNHKSTLHYTPADTDCHASCLK